MLGSRVWALNVRQGAEDVEGGDPGPGCTPLPSDCVPLPPQDYLDALTGICYDGIEGLLFLGLFSLLAALAFSTVTCAGLRAWKRFTTRWAAWAGGLPWGAGGGSALPEPRADRLRGPRAAEGPSKLPSFLLTLPRAADPQKGGPQEPGLEWV